MVDLWADWCVACKELDKYTGKPMDYDPNKDTNISFQSGYSWSKLQQITGIGRFIADGYEYSYYQLRGRYKNMFAQVYLNQGDTGETRGYDLGNVIRDVSENVAFQFQHNFDKTLLIHRLHLYMVFLHYHLLNLLDQ